METADYELALIRPTIGVHPVNLVAFGIERGEAPR